MGYDCAMLKKQTVDVRALAELARMEVSDADVAKLEGELPTILAFVDTIQKVSGDAPKGDPLHRNIMREDENPHESGLYTKELLEAAPESKQGQLVVKQVISRKKV